MGRNNLAGAWGEKIAAEFLRKKRYQLLASGYRTRFGEIDLIVKNRRMLVFVEVKLRSSSDFALAREFVDQRKQERIKKTALMFLDQYPTDLPVRFDVVEVYAPQGIHTARPVINHLEDAFQ
jgi:putative endonuclease